MRNYLSLFKWRLLLVVAAVFCLASLVTLVVRLNTAGWERAWFLGVYTGLYLAAFFLFIFVPENEKSIYFFLGTVVVSFLATIWLGEHLLFFRIASIVFPLIVFPCLDIRRGIVFCAAYILLYGIVSVVAGFRNGGGLLFPADFLYSAGVLVFSAVLGGTKEFRITAANRLLLNRIFYDELTGLPNRNMLIEKLTSDLSTKMCLGIFTLKDFKGITIFFGYRIGDQILRFMGGRLKEYHSAYDVSFFMMGGGEFAFLYTFTDTCPTQKEMEAEVLRFIEYIKDKPFVYQNHEMVPFITLGVAHYTNGGTSRLLSEADSALKSAVQNGHEYYFFIKRHSQDHEILLNMDRFGMLTSALAEGRIVPFFQPVVDNVTGKIMKFESLARMLMPNGDVYSPDYFLEVSRQSRVYNQVSMAILFRTFEAMNDSPFDFSLNVSQEDINNPEYFKSLEECFSQFPGTKGRVILELIETDQFDSDEKVESFINRAKAMGCRIAIDDFGTGYSNFARLIHWKIDLLKFDGSLIRYLDVDPQSHMVVDSIVCFSKKIGIQTVAEYVHSEPVHQKVKSLGIDFSQGFFFGKPEQDISGFNPDTKFFSRRFK